MRNNEIIFSGTTYYKLESERETQEEEDEEEESEKNLAKYEKLIRLICLFLINYAPVR